MSEDYGVEVVIPTLKGKRLISTYSVLFLLG